jgi:hypothetical protein
VDDAKIDPILLIIDREVSVRLYDRRIEHGAASVTTDFDDLMPSQILVSYSIPTECSLSRKMPISSETTENRRYKLQLSLQKRR